MTKTQAAEILATDVRVFARKAGHSEITKSLVEERVSELQGAGYVGTFKGDAARVCTVATVLRLARRDWI